MKHHYDDKKCENSIGVGRGDRRARPSNNFREGGATYPSTIPPAFEIIQPQLPQFLCETVQKIINVPS